jgi:hypothetical protein
VVLGMHGRDGVLHRPSPVASCMGWRRPPSAWTGGGLTELQQVGRRPCVPAGGEKVVVALGMICGLARGDGDMLERIESGSGFCCGFESVCFGSQLGALGGVGGATFTIHGCIAMRLRASHLRRGGMRRPCGGVGLGRCAGRGSGFASRSGLPVADGDALPTGNLRSWTERLVPVTPFAWTSPFGSHPWLLATFWRGPPVMLGMVWLSSRDLVFWPAFSLPNLGARCHSSRGLP